MSPMENKGLVCTVCGQAEEYGWNIEEGRCRACNRRVPVPLVFASVDEDPASAGANAAGEAALWLINHQIERDAVLSVQTATSVGGPLEQFPFAYTLTMVVEVPRYLIEDHTGEALETVETVADIVAALSRPRGRTRPPTESVPATFD